ncbi:unnamed protein product [Caenorhabditis angaria]|uniref:Uncharacterized protein n=1 Tax=Caenorhabditis angaria TaxID=860376 RepID=A0A9P1IH87_9PELO|nr:unnamed protein product [Caenorhabditis angaria]
MVEIKTAAQEVPIVFRKFIRRLPKNCSFDMKLRIEFSDDEEEEKERAPVKSKVEPKREAKSEASSSDPASFSVKKPRSMLCLNEINQNHFDSKQLFPEEFSYYSQASKTEISLSNETSFGETQSIVKNSSNSQNPPAKKSKTDQSHRKYSKTRSLTTMHSKTSLSNETSNKNPARKSPSYHDLYSANQRYPPSTTTAIISPKTVYENEHILLSDKNNSKKKNSKNKKKEEKNKENRISPLVSSEEKSEKSRKIEDGADGWALISAKKVGNDLKIDLKDLFL